MPRAAIQNPLGPGEVISGLIGELGITQRELARALKISQPYLSDIIRQKRGISAEVACKLSIVLGSTPETWMNIQSRYLLSKVDAKKFAKLSKLAA